MTRVDAGVSVRLQGTPFVCLNREAHLPHNVRMEILRALATWR
jgi:hypothetical protein